MTWSSWTLTPDIVTATGLVLAVYVSGMRRRRAYSGWQWERHALFFAGLAAVFVALQSPIDPMAEQLFFMHQVQHLLLRMLGPMLIMLSAPAGLLTAGLPARARRGLLGPTVSNHYVRALFGVLGQPAIATGIFIAALYVWQIPSVHDLALANEPVHYLMHVSMLAAGLIFWWRVFDRRPPPSPVGLLDERVGGWRFRIASSPHGTSYGIRLMMIWLVTLSNIVLGALTTLKTTVLYAAYGPGPRLLGLTPLQDEQAGGAIIWIPSSMMCLIALLVIIHWWGLESERLERRRLAQGGSNSAALLWPTTAAGLIAQARPKNRRLALGFTVFVVGVFITAMIVGVAGSRRVADPGSAPIRGSTTHLTHSGHELSANG